MGNTIFIQVLCKAVLSIFKIYLNISLGDWCYVDIIISSKTHICSNTCQRKHLRSDLNTAK